MDFTRQPLIESVITAKEGCKLVVRSSKGSGQEEYFVDAVEVVSFGNSFFFRSLEKPKSFLVPVSDYEILEVREARMVLKNVGLDRSIKIAGGKEIPQKQPKEPPVRQPISPPQEDLDVQEEDQANRTLDKKRDRRRTLRRRKRNEDGPEIGSEKNLIPPPPLAEKPIKTSDSKKTSAENLEKVKLSTTVINSLLPPPSSLISESIEKFKDNKMFQGIFVSKEPVDINKNAEEIVSSSEIHPLVNLEPVDPTLDSFEEINKEPLETSEEISYLVDSNEFMQKEDEPYLIPNTEETIPLDDFEKITSKTFSEETIENPIEEESSGEAKE